MTRLAYIDMAAGAAGDMILAGLVDAARRAGIHAEEAVTDAVAGLGLGCSVDFEEARRGGLRCLRADVRIAEDAPRGAAALRDALQRTHASEHAKARAVRGLDALVAAEARVHGVDPDQVHLHELGSADTAVDLIGTAVGFEALEITAVTAGPVPVPRGWIEAEHGMLPLPAPVTLELLRGMPTYGVREEDELVTPTALAVLRGQAASFGPLQAIVLDEVGIGGGTREARDRPNVCRILVGEPRGVAEPSPSPIAAPRGLRLERDVLLETNIDDQPSEGIGHALEELIAAGAKDAWITPIIMKKSRPGFLLSVLSAPSQELRMLEVLFRETTTLGVRRREVPKWAADRRDLHVPIRGTNVRVKVARLRGEVINVAPEYEDCVTVAERHGLPFKDVYQEAAGKARRLLEA